MSNIPSSSATPTQTTFPTAPVPPVQASRPRYQPREFGTGYGSSSGYASQRRYLPRTRPGHGYR